MEKEVVCNKCGFEHAVETDFAGQVFVNCAVCNRVKMNDCTVEEAKAYWAEKKSRE